MPGTVIYVGVGGIVRANFANSVDELVVSVCSGLMYGVGGRSRGISGTGRWIAKYAFRNRGYK